MKMEYPTLNSLYEQQSGKVSDKWALYLREYDRLLGGYQALPIRLLEIGIQNGGSLEKWTKFFPHSTRLIGCDINPECGLLEYEDPRISVIVGDANENDTSQQIFDVCAEFEIVIDDGSHRSGDIVKTFARYFSHVRDGGVFIAEDLHCSYWRNYEGGLFDPMSSVAFFKRLADIVSYEHWGVAVERKSILASFTETYGDSFNEEVLSHIHSVEFINSICVVRKQAPADNVLGWRVVAGVSEQVYSGLKPLHLTPHVAVDESGNPWNDVKNLPENGMHLLMTELQALKSTAVKVKSALEEAALRERASQERASTIELECARLVQVAQAKLNESIEARREIEADLERRHIHMLQSNSWRVTAPLRWLSSQIGWARSGQTVNQQRRDR